MKILPKRPKVLNEIPRFRDEFFSDLVLNIDLQTSNMIMGQ